MLKSRFNDSTPLLKGMASAIVDLLQPEDIPAFVAQVLSQNNDRVQKEYKENGYKRGFSSLLMVGDLSFEENERGQFTHSMFTHSSGMPVLNALLVKNLATQSPMVTEGIVTIDTLLLEHPDWKESDLVKFIRARMIENNEPEEVSHG